MNCPHLLNRPGSRSGFTLVELLVVIGIIAILASVTLTAGNAVIKAAKRASANNTAVQIQAACLAYYTEYSVYPVPTTQNTDYYIGDSVAADGASWATLLCVLSGNIEPSNGTAIPAPASGPTNTRAIAFLSMKSTDVYTQTDKNANGGVVIDAPKNPLPTSTTANLYFNITMDADYSGVLGDTTSAVTSKMPNFQTWTTAWKSSPTAAVVYGGTSTAGIAVWANCNGNVTLPSPTAYVHTY